HDVAAVARQLDSLDRFGWLGARLGELPGNAAKLHDRHCSGEGRHHRHLQKYTEKIANIIRRMLGKTLGAVAALPKERFTRCGLAQHALELARLTRENKRRKTCKLALDLGQRRLIGIIRHLLDRLASPARW